MRAGRVEVITGPMFAGKSEELVRRLTRAKIAKRSVGAFKHSNDTRYHETDIGSHAGRKFPARPYKTIEGLDRAVRGLEVIGIDEVQFFDTGLVELVETLANSGCRVIVAGLDLDAEGRPFGPIASLMAIADQVDKLSAVCMVCGEPAFRSFHKGGKTEQVEVGASQYEARCRTCWHQPHNQPPTE